MSIRGGTEKEERETGKWNVPHDYSVFLFEKSENVVLGALITVILNHMAKPFGLSSLHYFPIKSRQDVKTWTSLYGLVCKVTTFVEQQGRSINLVLFLLYSSHRVNPKFHFTLSFQKDRHEDTLFTNVDTSNVTRLHICGQRTSKRNVYVSYTAYY